MTDLERVLQELQALKAQGELINSRLDEHDVIIQIMGCADPRVQKAQSQINDVMIGAEYIGKFAKTVAAFGRFCIMFFGIIAAMVAAYQVAINAIRNFLQ